MEDLLLDEERSKLYEDAGCSPDVIRRASGGAGNKTVDNGLIALFELLKDPERRDGGGGLHRLDSPRRC